VAVYIWVVLVVVKPYLVIHWVGVASVVVMVVFTAPEKTVVAGGVLVRESQQGESSGKSLREIEKGEQIFTYMVLVLVSTAVEVMVLVDAVLVEVVVAVVDASTVVVQRSGVRRASAPTSSAWAARGRWSCSARRIRLPAPMAAARDALGGWMVAMGSLRRGATLQDVVIVLVTVVLVITGGKAGTVMVLMFVVVLITRLGVTVLVTVLVVAGFVTVACASVVGMTLVVVLVIVVKGVVDTITVIVGVLVTSTGGPAIMSKLL
jgi:hypothetical protein